MQKLLLVLKWAIPGRFLLIFWYFKKNNFTTNPVLGFEPMTPLNKNFLLLVTTSANASVLLQIMLDIVAIVHRWTVFYLGGGQLVSVLTFYSDEMSSNPADVLVFIL